MAIKEAKVKYRGTGGGGVDMYNMYEATFEGEAPDKDTLELRQIALGFHPLGYGGPFDIKVNGQTVTWRSFASCD